MNFQTRRPAACCVAVAFAATLTIVAGCGGSHGGTPAAATIATTGSSRAQITVQWPQRGAATRLIPYDANSLRVTFRSGTTVLQEQILLRPPVSAGGNPAPTSTANFLDLPQGIVSVEATAFPNSNGTGTVQARAQGNFTITAGQANPIGLSMGSTIERVDILPQDIPLTFQPVELNAVAYDAQNNLVLTTRWEWTNTDSTVVTLDPQGTKAIVQIKGAGVATVKARETESGKTAAKLFTVMPPP